MLSLSKLIINYLWPGPQSRLIGISEQGSLKNLMQIWNLLTMWN